MAVSSGLSLAFMVIGLLAVVFALVVVWRRTPGTSRSPLAQPADRSQLDSVAAEAEQIRARAETEATGILERARQEAEQAAQGRREVEEEIRAVKDEVRELRGDLERRETRLADREQRLDEELKRIEDRAQALNAKRHDLDRRAAELDRQDADRAKELERVAGLTAEAARGELVATIENQAKREAALIVRDIEHQARSEGEKRARKIVTLAIQRVATEQTSESVVSVLHLPGDEMKGRIIGREGRNIRAFESVTGVNLIIDDTPEAVLLSCFDPVRREIARLTLERLVLDGRIHPQRIEDAYERGKAEIEQLCKRAGEDALVELGITDMHSELVDLLGRLRYRTSYGQNVLKHLVESAHIAGLLTHTVAKNIGPWPCWYSGTFYAVGRASATVDLNPGPAWWKSGTGHYQLRVLRQPAVGVPGKLAITMALPLPQLPQSVHDVSVDNTLSATDRVRSQLDLSGSWLRCAHQAAVRAVGALCSGAVRGLLPGDALDQRHPPADPSHGRAGGHHDHPRQLHRAHGERARLYGYPLFFIRWVSRDSG